MSTNHSLNARSPLIQTIPGVAHLKKRVASVGFRPAAVVDSGNRTQGRFWSCRDPLRTGTIPISPQRFSPSRFVCPQRARRRRWFAYVSLVSVKELPDYAALDKNVDRKSLRLRRLQAIQSSRRVNHCFSLICAGAGKGSRTPKTRRAADFESAASASSAIPAIRGSA